MLQQSSTPNGNQDINQMYLVDLGRLASDADTQEDILEATQGLWSAIYERMEPNETLWVVAPNMFQGDGCDPWRWQWLTTPGKNQASS